MRRRHRKEDPTPAIMLSPMIDLIFLLLVFFIVSTMYMSHVKTINVQLPVAKTAQHLQQKSNFIVTIKKDGQLFLDDKPIELRYLVANASMEQKRNPQFAVIIRSDAEAQYQHAITLMDALKGAGVTRFGLATESGVKKP